MLNRKLLLLLLCLPVGSASWTRPRAEEAWPGCRANSPPVPAGDVQVDWRTMHGDKALLGVTKSVHNALEGAEVELTDTFREE